MPKVALQSNILGSWWWRECGTNDDIAWPFPHFLAIAWKSIRNYKKKKKGKKERKSAKHKYNIILGTLYYFCVLISLPDAHLYKGKSSDCQVLQISPISSCPTYHRTGHSHILIFHDAKNPAVMNWRWWTTEEQLLENRQSWLFNEELLHQQSKNLYRLKKTTLQ